MVLKLYMMYMLYLNHGKELNAKALPLIWCFVYRRSRLMLMGIMLSQAHYILSHHVNVQINKIPQLAMHCNVRDGGMISQGIRVEFTKPLIQ